MLPGRAWSHLDDAGRYAAVREVVGSGIVCQQRLALPIGGNCRWKQSVRRAEQETATKPMRCRRQMERAQYKEGPSLRKATGLDTVRVRFGSGWLAS
jgi:hypothetical protein